MMASLIVSMTAAFVTGLAMLLSGVGVLTALFTCWLLANGVFVAAALILARRADSKRAAPGPSSGRATRF